MSASDWIWAGNLNVSRLQNAADAAALAGAQTIVKEQDFNKYLVVSLAPNQLPADFDDYKDAYRNTFENGTTGVLRNYKSIEDIAETLKKGRASAEEFARKNLSDAEEVNHSASTTDTVSAIDGWSISADVADKKVSGTIELKYKIVDAKNDVYGPLYYVVNLTEKVRHLFMPGWFEDMDAPVRAVVLLKPHYKGLIEPMQELERTMVIDNWEYANKYKGQSDVYAGKWNHYMAGSTNNNTGIGYKTGDSYRTEKITVKTTSASRDGGQKTEANGGQFYDKTEVDSINLDFQAEIRVKSMFQTDWDLGLSPSKSLPNFSEYNHVEGGDSWGIDNGDDKRILYNVEFSEPFPTRDDTKFADPLWTRIESDPIIRQEKAAGGNVTVYNSVRQITLNFNTKNTDVGEKDGNKYYKQRPYVVFYTGPESVDKALDSNRVLVRHSQPVVLNFNEDTNAIFYMPNSPVIINGNNHTFHGFIIAKCFLQSVTEEEMLGNGSITLFDGFNEPSKFKAGFVKGTDGLGQTIYFRSKDLLTEAQVEAAHTDGTAVPDGTTGNIIVRKSEDFQPHPVISFTKDLYADCTTLEQYFTKTAEYINTNYTKARYAAFAGIEESQVSMITFPSAPVSFPNSTENPKPVYDNFTAITIPVATADLLDSDPDPKASVKDDKYVKVLLGTTEKYIDKAKLPHMRVKHNAKYPYVCIYDLKTGLQSGCEGGYVCVKPLDDSLPAPKNKDDNTPVVFLNSANEWNDVWVINKNLLEQKYEVTYIESKLLFDEVTSDSQNIFHRSFKIPSQAAILAKYHKIKLSTGDIRYVKDGDEENIEYYTKVQNNSNNANNYIILDKKGNMLTRAVTAPEILQDNITTVARNNELIGKVNSLWSRASDKQLLDYWKTYTRDPKDPEEIPGDRGEANNGKYVGLSEYRKYEDYRIPALERVYKMSAFNLNNNSYYSYFGIDLLWRVNYTYLNVDEVNHTVNRENAEESGLWKVEDMFFTTTRSSWID